MTFFVVSDAAGVILRTGECREADLEAQAQPGESVLEGKADMTAEYVDGASQTVVPKRIMSATLSGQTITGLPPGAVVSVDEADVFALTSGDTVIEFAFASGLYEIVCEAPTYWPKSFIVEVP